MKILLENSMPSHSMPFLKCFSSLHPIMSFGINLYQKQLRIHGKLLFSLNFASMKAKLRSLRRRNFNFLRKTPLTLTKSGQSDPKNNQTLKCLKSALLCDNISSRATTVKIIVKRNLWMELSVIIYWSFHVFRHSQQQLVARSHTFMNNSSLHKILFSFHVIPVFLLPKRIALLWMSSKQHVERHSQRYFLARSQYDKRSRSVKTFQAG